MGGAQERGTHGLACPEVGALALAPHALRAELVVVVAAARIGPRQVLAPPAGPCAAGATIQNTKYAARVHGTRLGQVSGMLKEAMSTCIMSCSSVSDEGSLHATGAAGLQGTGSALSAHRVRDGIETGTLPGP